MTEPSNSMANTENRELSNRLEKLDCKKYSDIRETATTAGFEISAEINTTTGQLNPPVELPTTSITNRTVTINAPIANNTYLPQSEKCKRDSPQTRNIKTVRDKL